MKRTKQVMDLWKLFNKSHGKMWSKNPIISFNFKREVAKIDLSLKQKL